MVTKIIAGLIRKMLIIILILVIQSDCYEKTLRKIVRNQSKMVQKPFSDNPDFSFSNKLNTSREYVYPGYAEVKSVIHKMQRPKISTILSSIDTGRGKSMYSRMNIAKYENTNPYELRMARDAINYAIHQSEGNSILPNKEIFFNNNQSESFYNFIPTSKFFPPVDETTQHPMSNTAAEKAIEEQNNTLLVNDTFARSKVSIQKETNDINSLESDELQLEDVSNKVNIDKPECIVKESKNTNTLSNFSELINFCNLIKFNEIKVDVDAQAKFSKLDIEPSWMEKEHFWNQIYESRYESLMRNPKWPPLKVILMPRSQVHSIWKQSFESLHNDTVRSILSNVIKKLQFYPNATFSWHEVSHLSKWWMGACQKSRSVLRRLINEGRLEITTGMWVETDESMASLFGLIHQLTEGHQWLQNFLNYSPEVAWLTSSVTHSPTICYLLSASGINSLILTNLHYSWQQYFTEYQYTDFIWVQNWDNNRDTKTNLNEALGRIGKDRFSKYSTLTHYLQFNTDSFDACGPEGDVCATEFNFANENNNLDINTFNVKDKSERILEQYSKTGTTSVHNIVIAPLGDQFCYESQTEFDYQYNNYEKIAEFVNNNKDIYKTIIEFGTPKDYFKAVSASRVSFPTLKGDFLNYADINDGVPAYWTGFFTTRTQLKILLRRLESTLRSTEIIFSFALNFDVIKTYNASKLFEMLLNAREVVARLQDRHVVSGTLTSKAMSYVYTLILKTTKDCWHIQELAASSLSSNKQNRTYLEKYVYREGEFISSFKSVTHGDQIYVFNSLTYEKTEIIEFITRQPNLRVFDHNKKEITIQINPTFKFDNKNKIVISSQFFKITFAAVVPTMAFQVYKIKNAEDAKQSFSTIYCMVCDLDDAEDDNLSFDIQAIEAGDIQLENYEHRLLFDEYSGFLKSVTKKSINITNVVAIDFGAFRSSHKHSGMFLFNTNYSQPLDDILSSFRQNPQLKIIFIISGQITTELLCIYGSLIQHSVKIFNLMNNTLSSAIKIETKIDYDVPPKYRELEIFMAIQTDIDNGNPPRITTDNNGFQYTTREINVNRRIESNIYPITSMVFIQDSKRRLSIVTDHGQGVTALQEGQIVLMLDRRVPFDDGRGSEEGITDGIVTHNSHYLLLENFKETSTRSSVKLPSLLATYLSNALNYPLDIFFIEARKAHLCHYAFRPLVIKPFPCGVMMINYRVIINRGSRAKYFERTSLMTLHRQSFTCMIDQNDHSDCKEMELRLDKMFHHLRAVYQTNLVGTSEGAVVNILNESNFPPFEITTFRVYF